MLYFNDFSRPSLAPVYDVLSTAIYPQLTKKMALRIGGINLPDTVHLEHWLSLLPDTAASKRLITKELNAMASTTAKQAAQLLAEFQKSKSWHPVLNDINKVIQSRAHIVGQRVSS